MIGPRLRQFYANARLGGTLRTVLVVGLFGFLAVTVLVRHGNPWLLLALVAGALLPVLLRRPMLDRLELTNVAMRWYAWILCVSAALAGFMKESIERAVDETTLLTVMGLLVGLYMSAYVVVCSDPEVQVR